MIDISVFGHGEVLRATLLEQVSNVVSSTEGGVRFIIPISEPQSKAAMWVAEWAQARNHPFNVVYDIENVDERQDSIMESAVREIESTGLINDMVRSNRSGTYLVAMDDTDATSALVEAGIRAGARAYDLTDQLGELVLDGTETESDEPEVVPEPFPVIRVHDEVSTDMGDFLARLTRIEEKLDSVVRQSRTPATSR